MAAERRTTQQVIDEGFRALVEKLGREDAIRFVRQFRSPDAAPSESTDSEEHLPPMSVEEAHEKILDIQGQQGNLL